MVEHLANRLFTARSTNNCTNVYRTYRNLCRTDSFQGPVSEVQGVGPTVPRHSRQHPRPLQGYPHVDRVRHVQGDDVELTVVSDQEELLELYTCIYRYASVKVSRDLAEAA